jgi:hypothetical protein
MASADTVDCQVPVINYSNASANPEDSRHNFATSADALAFLLQNNPVENLDPGLRSSYIDHRHQTYHPDSMLVAPRYEGQGISYVQDSGAAHTAKVTLYVQQASQAFANRYA